MLIQASNLLNKAVASLDEKNKIGQVKYIIIDRKALKVLGFLVKDKNLFFKNKFLSDIDILDIDKYAVVTRSYENLIDPQEVVKVKNILKAKFTLFGLKAKNKKNEYLGKVSDFVFDKETLGIIRFYIRGFWQDRIFDISNLIKIKDKEIIFEDDLEKNISKKTIKTEELRV